MKKVSALLLAALLFVCGYCLVTVAQEEGSKMEGPGVAMESEAASMSNAVNGVMNQVSNMANMANAVTEEMNDSDSYLDESEDDMDGAMGNAMENVEAPGEKAMEQAE